MNKSKLTESISLFKRYYLDYPEFYMQDEKGWKWQTSVKFQDILAQDKINNDSFIPSFKSIYISKDVAYTIRLLSGGTFYQYQRFLDLLNSSTAPTIIQRLFDNLLYSKGRIKNRINEFKKSIDNIYKGLDFKGNIQLNLISQFLGLNFPNEHYIYKSTEFSEAKSYFEYQGKLQDDSAGSVYEYYESFVSEIRSTMNEVGLNNVDFVDVQTFIFRKDWYKPTNLSQEIGTFERDEAKAKVFDTRDLLERIRKSKPVPPKLVKSIYHYRNPNISALVKIEADGKCDLCNMPAPFENLSGDPFLESHHIKPLADGGKDEILNSVALCPNCHRKMHILNLEPDTKKLQIIAQERYERLSQKPSSHRSS